ncbi:ABC transporter ATP-binding protein [Maritimibacter fusiformis]|uniref:sn-glycerol-3-phosphate ABC transporter ATP-binding protein UgpC n=1 Tax=Maritimibacter fusiformis TaxID=2603819 RepID=A0A5D0RK41_9RHOB|nr:sn-glycerol-3-phosphate ABC transporter ATP-binding protein UgpC [Maritimibacter fusiformis]TYB81145.1 sn-glycerol-3-phosphate ABC transporter ATP-binding protein UgpC [Maritimibacter fusiformis]
MATVKLKNVTKSFGTTEVIKGVDIDIEDGEFVVFVGPSGCGKSTLLRMISGLEDITSGTIEIGGVVVNDLPPKERGIAMVFQTYGIFPHMTVRENVAFGLTINKADKQTKEAKVQEAARILQMEHLLDRRPSQLSGGQRQRVAIGRAIVRDPKVFLFDEPLSNLDAALRMDMRLEIGKLHQKLAATMIYVTHDQVEAMTLADKIVVLKDGKVMQVGAPMELYHEPANLFVAGFLGAPSMNFIRVTVEALDGGEARVTNKALDPIVVDTRGRPFAVGQEAILGVRPQYLHPVPDAEGKLHGKITVTERLGAETVVEVTLEDGEPLIAALSEDRIYQSGEKIGFDFDTGHAQLFPPED